MREVGLEAVRAHPWRYLRGVLGTVLDELWSPLHVALPGTAAAAAAPPRASGGTSTGHPPLPVPSEGEQIPSARQGFFSTTPDGSITERWTSATDHRLVFATPEAEERFARLEADSGRLAGSVPPYSGSEWLTLQLSRSSKLYPPPLLWIAVGLGAWLWRRPRGAGLAACVVLGALGVVTVQALAIYSIIEFAIPVAPAFVVFGAAGLVGQRRTR
jgi:hypothetical protein